MDIKEGAIRVAEMSVVVCVHVEACVALEEVGPLLESWFDRHGQSGADTLVVVEGRIAQACTAAIEHFLSNFAGADVSLVASPEVLGCVGALRLAQRRFPYANVAYVKLGTVLPADWIDRLRRVLARDERVGVISPLADVSPVFSPFGDARPGWIDAGHVDAWLTVLSRAHVFEVPEILGICALFRGEALNRCLSSSSAREGLNLIAAMRGSGWSCVGCDWLFAEWSLPNRPDADPALGFAADRDLFLAAHPLGRMRHGFGEAGTWGANAVPAARNALLPVQLHITHCWGGGLGKWVRDMCEADSTRHNLVLRAIGTWGGFGHRVSLYSSHEMGVALREWHLDQPIKALALTHYQYRRILDEIIRDFEVDVIMVSSLIGHSLDALQTKCPTLVCAHDYFPFCPALVIRFGAVCQSCDGPRLGECFDSNPLNHFFRETGADEWGAIRDRYLALMQASHIRLVAPSLSVIRHLRELAPELGGVQADVVPNGIDTVQAKAFEPGQRLTVVVLGSLAAHKGADLLFDAIPQILEFADVHLIGCGSGGDRFRHFPGVCTVPEFRHEELAGLIFACRPHVGLLLSVVPETFSYTLSELWALGVVPVATRVGSFADRIEPGVNGFLINPDAKSLVGVLEGIERNREQLVPIQACIRSQPAFGREDMVDGYHRLAFLAPWIGVPGPGPAVTQAGHAMQRQGALHVDRQAPLRLVLIDFIDYLIGKCAATPRLGPRSRSVLVRLLRQVSRLAEGRKSP